MALQLGGGSPHLSNGEMLPVDMRLDLRKIGVTYAAAVAVLALLGAGAAFAPPQTDSQLVREVVARFHLDREATIPTFLQAAALMTCACLLALIAYCRRRVGDPHAKQWLILGAAFFYIALDESSELHEMTWLLMRRMPGLAGVFTWIYLFVPLVIVLGFYLLKWLLALPTGTRTRFVFAAALFLGGAVGLEIITGAYVAGTQEWWNAPIYRMLAWVEEVLEMAGVGVFFVALLAYLRDTVGMTPLEISSSSAAAANVAGATGPAPARPRPPSVPRPSLAPASSQRLDGTAGYVLATAGIMLLLYSLLLVAAEYRNSQPYVRPYFTDIRGPVMLFGINTTLSAVLLWGVAIVSLLSLLFLRTGGVESRARMFFLAQIGIFTYLGLDERFMLHERLGGRLQVEDTWILVAVGLVEVAVLWFLGDLKQRSVRARAYLLVAGVLFCLMAFIDAFLPSVLPLRLSFEDLTKMWSSAFLFLFAFQIFAERTASATSATAGDQERMPAASVRPGPAVSRPT